LRKVYGLFTLYAHSTSYLDEMSNLLLKTDDKRKHIDTIELAFTAISGTNVALWDGIKKGVLWECCLENLLRWDGVIQPTLWESSP
ncbi:hypothetical protein MJO10_29190, partial [Salmonella enterica subsp. enterica serovar Anatum]|nr:hypothetical protein [Salmonella enterica subsp. enterica serovar Anatum]